MQFGAGGDFISDKEIQALLAICVVPLALTQPSSSFFSDLDTDQLQLQGSPTSIGGPLQLQDIMSWSGSISGPSQLQGIMSPSSGSSGAPPPSIPGGRPPLRTSNPTELTHDQTIDQRIIHPGSSTSANDYFRSQNPLARLPLTPSPPPASTNARNESRTISLWRIKHEVKFLPEHISVAQTRMRKYVLLKDTMLTKQQKSQEAKDILGSLAVEYGALGVVSDVRRPFMANSSSAVESAFQLRLPLTDHTTDPKEFKANRIAQVLADELPAFLHTIDNDGNVLHSGHHIIPDTILDSLFKHKHLFGHILADNLKDPRNTLDIIISLAATTAFASLKERGTGVFNKKCMDVIRGIRKAGNEAAAARFDAYEADILARGLALA
ncbi:hypothetical protein SERLA73DRAFT_153551 [Serpula lacrymans var. lacrymans S7.3]|uniref:DUF6532 domain-containing protein n=1 Tax=Serpula lacrymans var. lacrymans (strain S7.3) TaxID=936435 RepID=F8Q046_SERL3|nr:hypothetical protein SERLA73DRAFT_153551 [Serpula lacrymans var. lacrymans S7.3]